MKQQHHHAIAAKLSHLSYKRLHHQTFKWSSNLSNNDSDVQAYSFETDTHLYITIKGTTSLKDWWRNFQTRLLVTPYADEGYTGAVKIHSGFYTGYLTIQEQVLRLSDTDKKLIIDGHSQGGAIAPIAAVDIQYRLGKEVEAVIFGAPPIGNEAWSNSANKRIKLTAYNNLFDIVPYLLPSNCHAGKHIKLNKFNWNPHNTKNYHKNTKAYVLHRN